MEMPKEDPFFLDRLGNDLVPGDFVVYTTNGGDTLFFGQVVSPVWVKRMRRQWGNELLVSWDQRLKVRVMNWRETGFTHSVLWYAHRVLRVNRALVPANFLKLIKKMKAIK